MQHSIKQIGSNYEKLSIMRKDKNPFNKEDFYQFAKSNMKKYSIIENGDDLLVSTWYSGSLIYAYQETILK
jgi:hypothetical protein